LKDVHGTRTPSGIEIPDPDQGTAHVLVQLHFPTAGIAIWEPFDDGQEGGHNLLGFTERWKEWAYLGVDQLEAEKTHPYLYATEPRFGFPIAIPRSVIDQVSHFCIEFRRREDVRAGHRGLALPGGGVRRLPNGDIEIQVPRG
jgi:hypothetical protein